MLYQGKEKISHIFSHALFQFSKEKVLLIKMETETQDVTFYPSWTSNTLCILLVIHLGQILLSVYSTLLMMSVWVAYMGQLQNEVIFKRCTLRDYVTIYICLPQDRAPDEEMWKFNCILSKNKKGTTTTVRTDLIVLSWWIRKERGHIFL